MENVYARNIQASGMSGTHVLNSACSKEEQFQKSFKAVNLFKQSCSVHYKHLWNSKVKNTYMLNTFVYTLLRSISMLNEQVDYN